MLAGYAHISMSRNSASTIATGGAGYTFADKVAGAFLVQMLQRAFPFEPELGIIAEIHFETRESGDVLDDLQLVLRSGNEVLHHFVIVALQSCDTVIAQMLNYMAS